MVDYVIPQYIYIATVQYISYVIVGFYRRHRTSHWELKILIAISTIIKMIESMDASVSTKISSLYVGVIPIYIIDIHSCRRYHKCVNSEIYSAIDALSGPFDGIAAIIIGSNLAIAIQC